MEHKLFVRFLNDNMDKVTPLVDSTGLPKEIQKRYGLSFPLQTEGGKGPVEDGL